MASKQAAGGRDLPTTISRPPSACTWHLATCAAVGGFVVLCCGMAGCLWAPATSSAPTIHSDVLAVVMPAPCTQCRPATPIAARGHACGQLHDTSGRVGVSVCTRPPRCGEGSEGDQHAPAKWHGPCNGAGGAAPSHQHMSCGRHPESSCSRPRWMAPVSSRTLGQGMIVGSAGLARHRRRVGGSGTHRGGVSGAQQQRHLQVWGGGPTGMQGMREMMSAIEPPFGHPAVSTSGHGGMQRPGAG